MKTLQVCFCLVLCVIFITNSSMRNRNKFSFVNTFWFGFISGILLPLVVFLIYHALKFSGIPVIDFVKAMHNCKLLFRIMSLCVLSDLPLFYLYLQTKKTMTARGVVASCFLYTFIVIIYMVIF